MNDIEARLVALNQALLENVLEKKILDKAIIDQAVQTLAGYSINMGAGNDTLVINHHLPKKCDDPPEPPPNNGCDCSCKTVSVSEDYSVLEDDCYIGVDSGEPTTITLPSETEDGHIVTIKAEMGPPLGNRKVTIIVDGGGLIDGDTSIELTVPYSSITVLFNNGQWFII